MLSGSTKKCADCGLTKDIDQFFLRMNQGVHRNSTCRSSKCRDCERTRSREYRRQKRSSSEGKEYLKGQREAWAQSKYDGPLDELLRWRFVQLRREDRKGLTPEYFVSLFHRQGGKCYYTGSNLDPKDRTSHERMSIDKLDPALGYVDGNVVLCTYSSNVSKWNRTESEFYAFCRRVLEVSASRASSPCA